MSVQEKIDIINKWIDYAWEMNFYGRIPKIPHAKLFFLKSCGKFIVTDATININGLELVCKLWGFLDSRLGDSSDEALEKWVQD